MKPRLSRADRAMSVSITVYGTQLDALDAFADQSETTRSGAVQKLIDEHLLNGQDRE